ncbi:lipopolysaccharide kinase InaA family protein [Streptosporangium saharense]|uniref:lipopolysaccharide kinase InaA family protein n=1 Tax=Streptosporangium saharense TaxID=1706840 RepID=UPI0033230E01
MTTTSAEAIALVTAAHGPRDLFGGREPRRVYRRLARLLHPDLAPGPEAARAFARLAGLWAEHTAEHTGHTPADDLTGTVLGTHRVGPVFREGTTAVLYGCAADTLLKIPRSPADNDLMRREAQALRTIEQEGDPVLLPYVPRLVDSLRHGPGGAQRRANVISRVPDGFVTLAEITRRRPVLDPRDAAWIWRRLLVAIGAAHRAGVVHGAVFGHHVLVHPVDHGLVLVDWSQSVPLGGPLKVLVARHRDDYPPEVLTGAPATEALDIRLATRCVSALMGDRVPGAISRFVRGSLAAPPRDAWGLLAELDELLDDLYGPRTYRPLHL